jgi:hydroxymethylpyrimidine/phosphomethylpyrimidine kinase
MPETLRGTGCALASAIAAGLARELPLIDACREGKRYIMRRFERALAAKRMILPLE